MYELFIALFNRSITVGWLILAVLVVRFLSKRMPKIWHCFLWYLVMLRLLLPISVESEWSLIPNVQVITEELLYSQNPMEDLESIDFRGQLEMSNGSFVRDGLQEVVVDFVTPNEGDSVKPLQVIAYGASYIWLLGMIIMFGYTCISFIRVKRRMRRAVLLNANIYQSEYVESPFVVGVIKPRIYVPFSLSGESLECVIAHERTHIKRLDPGVRLIAFLLLSVYWFHPFVWVFYLMLCRDMELACDEMVLKQIGMDKKKLYSQTLLKCSVSSKKIAVCPLAFGETSVKERIKNILHFRKPHIWMIIGTVVLCVVLVVCFMTNPKQKKESVSLIAGVDNSSEAGAESVGAEMESISKDELLHTKQEVEKSEQILQQEANSQEVRNLKEPPILCLQDALSSQYNVFSVQAGTYGWYYDTKEGRVGIEACGAHPLEAVKSVEYLKLPKYNRMDDVPYMFGYSVLPDYMEIEEYDIADMGNVEAKPLDKQTMRENMFVSLKQNRIYSIRAVWEESKMEERGFYGDAYYTVVTTTSSDISVNSEKDLSQNIYDVNNLNGATMTMEEYNSMEGTVKISNESGRELTYGDWYEIQVYQNGNWCSMPLIIDNAGFHDIGYAVSDKNTSVWKINWSYFYGELEKGKYRIVKDISDIRKPGDYTKYYLAAEFEIK